jgi:hypothetical protein
MLFWDFTQHRMVISYRRIGATFRSKLSLRMLPIGCPEMSVRDYHSTLRKIPKRPQISFTPRLKTVAQMQRTSISFVIDVCTLCSVFFIVIYF